MTRAGAASPAIRRVVTWVAALNLAYFAVEFTIAVAIDSVSLFADSIDFLEDASVNALILLALGWQTAHRARVGMLLATLLLIPSAATAWAAWHKFATLAPPAATPLSLAGLGALVVNLSCAFMLTKHRQSGGSLTRAAFLSARNDAFANVAIIGAAVLIAYTGSGWPDLIVGLGIFLLNLDAAREVYTAARRELRAVHETGGLTD